MAPTWHWIGVSDRSYRYKVFKLPVAFDGRQFGNYVLAKHGVGGRWIPIYIGEGDLAKRIGPNHYKAHCIKSKGATHAHVHLTADEHDRRAEMRDMLSRHREAYEPIGCNDP